MNVLVGRNGAGKSAFLDIFRFVRDALRLGLETAIDSRHGIASLRRWAPRKPYNIEIGLTVETKGFWGEYLFVISSGQQGKYRRARELCRVGKTPFDVQTAFEIKGDKFITAPDRLLEISDMLDAFLEPHTLVLHGAALFLSPFSQLRRNLNGHFYSIFPNTLRLPQKLYDEEQLLDHGENFASIVRQMQKDSSQFSKLISSLGRVVDGVTDLRVRQVGGYLVTELKHEDVGPPDIEDRSAWFELDQESDGTLRLLGMLVALYQSLPPSSLLALEEPENTLHPGALAVLSDVLYEASRRNQIIVTTQSPDLISRFKADELLVVERNGGISQIGHVDEMQREAIEEQLFTSGDLLRIEGLRRGLAMKRHHLL
ncbi:MAG: ATP-binding protein [Blastocatellia bacterium]|nr:ATP-binding protein [Blastocatellia bacterium]